MTFSHISDMHLGQTQYGEPERENDMYSAFDQAIDTSIKDHVEFVILAGDLFDNPNPGGRAIVSFGNSLKRLYDAKIPAYFILGEHDLSRVASTPVAFVYHNLRVAKYIGDGSPIKNGDTLIVGFDKMRKDEIPKHSTRFAQADNDAQKHTGPRILVMHQGVIEINKFAGELATNDLPKSFSYYAMGHLHDSYKQRFENLGGLLAYPGSTESSKSEGIRESEKGFYEVDLSSGEASASWIKLNTRPHRVFSLAYDELQSSVSAIASQLSKYDKKPVVKIKVDGDQVDMNAINTLIAPLNDASLCCQIVTEQSIERADIMSGKPTKKLDELMRYTKKSLNDDALSEFVINNLLPLFSSNKNDDALALVRADYEKFKAGKTK